MYSVRFIYCRWCLSSFRKKLEQYTGIVLLFLEAYLNLSSLFSFFIFLSECCREGKGYVFCNIFLWETFGGAQGYFTCSLFVLIIPLQCHHFKIKLCLCSRYLVMQENEKVACFLILVSLCQVHKQELFLCSRVYPRHSWLQYGKNLSISIKLATT